MTHHKYLNEFKTERLVLSLGFMLLVTIIVAVYIIQNESSLFVLATQAFESPREVVSGVIRGMAQR